jgi:hypothetical protein
MRDGSPDITRFSAMDEREGCTKFTLAADPMLKLSHCAVSLSLDWFTVSTLPEEAMLPEPATTWPLAGSALPGSVSAKTRPACSASTASMTELSRGRNVR